MSRAGERRNNDKLNDFLLSSSEGEIEIVKGLMISTHDFVVGVDKSPHEVTLWSSSFQMDLGSRP